MSLLKKFSEAAQRRLRLRQIQILFQNQTASQFLHDNISSAIQLKPSEGHEILDALAAFRLATATAIVDLSIENALSDERSKELAGVNAALKNLYSGFIDGQHKARAARGAATGDLVPFNMRFSPAKGMKNISDDEWDAMVSNAFEILEQDK